MGSGKMEKLVLAVSEEVLFPVPAEQEVRYPGPAFPLIRGMLDAAEAAGMAELVEVIVFSSGRAEDALLLYRVFQDYGLHITRAVFTGGASVTPYLPAFQTDLFLSADSLSVQEAADREVAAGLLWTDSWGRKEGERAAENRAAEVRLAFDGDAVLFSDASEKIYTEYGLSVFEEHESRYAQKPLEDGPLAALFRKLAVLKRNGLGEKLRTALVTARCAPAHERVLRTLQTWNASADEVFFLGGLPKKEILEAFGADLFFDDQRLHVASAAEFVPSALVPGRHRKIEETGKKHEIRQYCGGNLSGEAKPLYRLCGVKRQEGNGSCQKYGQMPRTAGTGGSGLSAGK